VLAGTSNPAQPKPSVILKIAVIGAVIAVILRSLKDKKPICGILLRHSRTFEIFE